MNCSTAGEISILVEQALSSFNASSGIALGWSLPETIQFSRKLNKDDLLSIIRIVGIEGEQFEMGKSPSQEIIEKNPHISNQLDAKMIIMSHLTGRSSSFEQTEMDKVIFPMRE